MGQSKGSAASDSGLGAGNDPGPDAPITAEFVKAIRKLAQDRGWTQKALAEKIGVKDDKFLTTWEGRLHDEARTKPVRVKLRTLIKLAGFFDQTPEEILLPDETCRMIRGRRPDLRPAPQGTAAPVPDPDEPTHLVRDDLLRTEPDHAPASTAPPPDGGEDVPSAVAVEPRPAAETGLDPGEVGEPPRSPTAVEVRPDGTGAGPPGLWAMALTCLAYWLVAGVVPLAALAADHRDPWARDGLARLSARVYSHLFLFPVTCGVLLVGLLFGPITALLVDRGPKTGRVGPTRPLATLWAVLWLAASLLVAVVDFFGGNHALWEVDPALVARQGGELVDHFRDPPRDPQPTARVQFARRIDAWIDGGPRNWSWARWAYVVGQFFQISTLIAIPFLTIMSWSKTPTATDGDPEGAATTRHLVLALFVATFWLMTRLTFLAEKAAFYPSFRIVGLDVINVLLFILSYVFTTILTCRLRSPDRWLLLPILGCGAALALGFTAMVLRTGWPARIFGRGCEEVHFLLLPFFLALVILSVQVAAKRGAAPIGVDRPRGSGDAGQT